MCISWASTQFTSLPCASDTGGENPYIDTQDGLKASDCGRLGRQAAGHPWSALRVVKSCRKDCPTASVLPKPKAAALRACLSLLYVTLPIVAGQHECQAGVPH